MALRRGVDRGGLRYPIEIVDEFSKPLSDFREGIATAEAAFGRFRATAAAGGALFRDAASGIRSFDRAARRLNEAPARTQALAAALREVGAAGHATATAGQSLQQIGAAARTIGQSNRLRSVARGLTELGTAAGSLGNTAAKVDELTRALARLGVVTGGLQGALRGTSSGLRQLSTAGAQADAGASRARLGVEGLSAAQERAARSGNSLLFTFRRMFGVFAAFTVLRNVSAGFTDLVGRAVDFNAGIEQAQGGLAGLFTAVGQVRNAQGDLVSGAEAFALAQTEARKQLTLLRRDALTTAATFDELVDAFQQAVAPGLTAGLNIDQVREFSVRVSQAAGALGIAGNQLAEEIRSILSGTIQARTTRIATALGITNDDIRQAKEAGRLAEFLEERFRAFKVAGDAALQNFSVLVANLRGALDLVLGSASRDFFDELKRSLSDLQRLLVVSDDGGLLSPNPRAVQTIRQVSDGLREAVAVARDFVRSLDPADVEAVATVLGQAFALVAQVLGAVLEGGVSAFGNLARAAAPALDVIRSIVGESRGGLATFVAWALQLRAVSALSGPLSVSFSALFSAERISAATAVLRNFSGSLLGVTAIVAGLLALFGFLQSSLQNSRGETVSLANTITIALLNATRNVASAIKVVQEFVRVAVAGLTTVLPNEISRVLDRLVIGFAQSVRDLARSLADMLRKAPDVIVPDALLSGLEGIADAATDKIGELAGASVRAVAESGRAVEEARRRAAVFAADIDGLIAGIEETISEVGDEKGGAAFLEDPLKATLELLDTVQAKLRATRAEATAEAEGIGSISGPAQAVEALAEANFKQNAAAAGQEAGETTVDAYVKAVHDGQMSAQISQEVLSALILDPDDQTQIINSFSDLIENIKNLFKDNPLGFILGLLGGQPIGPEAFVGGGAGFARGGKATASTASRARPSLAHFVRPQGFAFGGRPAGLDPRDRIPVWTRLGEWMIRPESAAYYGDRIMGAINSALIPRAALEAAASSAPAVALRTPLSGGFAFGGRVTEVAASAPAAAAPIVTPAIVANEQTLDELLSGGFPALVRQFSRNANVLKAALQIR